MALTGPVEVTEGKRRAVVGKRQHRARRPNRVSRVNLEGNAQAFDVDSLRAVELKANRVQGDFDAASGELRHLTAENDVLGESKGKGSTSSLTAEHFDMDLGGKHPQPLHGVATGNVHINLESQASAKPSGKDQPRRNGLERKTLTAAEVKFEFRPETHALKTAETVGPGTLLVSPADPKTGEKVITAGQFLMAFDARSRIESLRGTAPTQVLFRPPTKPLLEAPRSRARPTSSMHSSMLARKPCVKWYRAGTTNTVMATGKRARITPTTMLSHKPRCSWVIHRYGTQTRG